MVNFPDIPEEGTRFRLRARDSQYVIYSRIHNKPLVWHTKGPEHDNQLFTLIYGKGPRQNYYVIKSVSNGKVLFSRRTSKPYIGNIDGDGAYNDDWFQFIQDDGDPKSFRIYNRTSDTVFFSRFADPQFGNYTGPKYSDQLFHFELVDEDAGVMRGLN